MSLDIRNDLVRTFIMDGNFSAEHMRHCSGENDTPLSAGMAFMANPETYKAHLLTGKEMSQVCAWFSSYLTYLISLKASTCNTYKAIEQANSNRAHLDVTGIGATACNHGFFVPTSVVDFQKGERYVPSIHGF
jgi:Kyakuja-Dileera-Zisupton transposase